jgi:signal transduction histidine kinase
VPADHRRLVQVLDNLIANAVKFSHRNQRVLVTAGYDGRHWRIDVTDTGIGIPPEEAGQLFTLSTGHPPRCPATRTTTWRSRCGWTSSSRRRPP